MLRGSTITGKYRFRASIWQWRRYIKYHLPYQKRRGYIKDYKAYQTFSQEVVNM